MNIIDVPQGTDAWHQFRLEHFGASEAAPMLGLSKKIQRNELLRMKSTGLAREFSDWVQANILDYGHEVEASARPHVEQLICDDLYPVTCATDRISASCDGLTMTGDIAFEHKQWNAELAAAVEAGAPPTEHMAQCQQVLMVTGAQKLFFVVSDGTPGRMVYCWVRPQHEWFERLRAGWAQFEADLATYVPTAPTVAAVAAPVESLPAVSVRLDGALAVVSNLQPFGVALRAFIDRIPKRPTTDQEFADTDAACKRLKAAEEALEAAESAALSSISDVELMRRTVGDLREIARNARLVSEKMVKMRKEQIREEECRRGREAVDAHVAALNQRLGRQYMPPIAGDFPGAIRGLKNIDSLRNAIDTEIARVKIEANAVADRIDVNLKTMAAVDPDMQSLFADRASLALKEPDAVAAIVGQRIAEKVAADERRLEAERARIRAEEQARADREAAARAAEQRAAEDETRQQQERERAAIAAVAAIPPHLKADPAPRPAFLDAPIYRNPPAAVMGPPTMSMRAIATRLGFTVTAEFLTSLGFPPASSAGAAKLYHEHQFSQICDALIVHIKGAGSR